MNLRKTEEIRIKESKAAFAFGLICNDDEATEGIRELFDLHVNFAEQTRVNGKKVTNYTNVTTHNCSTDDFYNINDGSFELLNIKYFECMDEKEFIENQLEGIYTDEFFTYYRFTVSSKNNSEEFFNKIDDFLLQNDCKLQFYYTDITLNLSDYNKPISSYINSLFIQLNPATTQAKNVFFMNYHLFNESQLFHIFEYHEIPRITVGFSRTEEYSLYKGLNRYSTKPFDYQNYAKLFIRVDNKKVVIKRKYQNFMEFFSDNSVFLANIYTVLNLILSFYARFKAKHSITNKLFYFEGIENNKFGELKKIKNLLNSTKKK